MHKSFSIIAPQPRFFIGLGYLVSYNNMIDADLLEQFGAKKIVAAHNTFLFNEGEKALFYWQVAEGIVKMINYSANGKSFIQGVFREGESFGEPPLFADIVYPSNAVAETDAVVWKLSKDSFFKLLREHFDLHLKMTEVLSKRLDYKAMLLKEISSQSPKHRLLTLIDYMKNTADAGKDFYEVPYTRKQLAEMTGLRVETVIRNIKALEKLGYIIIKNRKVFRK